MSEIPPHGCWHCRAIYLDDYKLRTEVIKVMVDVLNVDGNAHNYDLASKAGQDFIDNHFADQHPDHNESWV